MQSIAVSLQRLLFVVVLLAGGYLGYCSNSLSPLLFASACILVAIAAWWTFYVAFQRPPRDETVKLYTAVKVRIGAKSGNSFVFDSHSDVVPLRVAIQRDVETVAIARHGLNAPLARIYVIHPCGYVHKTLRRVDATTIVSHRPELCMRHLIHHLWAFLPVQAKEIRELAGYYKAA